MYTANEWNQYTDGANVNDTNDNPAHTTRDGRHKPAAACPEPGERDAQWFAQNAEYSYDFDAARSGAIGDSQATWMEATVDGPGTITFDYKLSAAAGDTFTFWVDGQVVFSRSGSMAH